MASTECMREPLVTIGIPVYNGERFISRAITSLLAQSHRNCEIIISDNASTDDTQSICEGFARQDRRITYLRQTKNIGAPQNWNVLVHKASGEYFKWASANDYCAPDMVAQCLEIMQADPGVVLCYGLTLLVDENERPIEVYRGDRSYNEERPSTRFERVYNHLAMNNAQCGVFRLATLRRTGLDRPYPSGDLSLMSELSLYGRFVLIPEVLLYRRQSRKTFTALMTPLERQRVYDPKAKAPMKLIQTRRLLDNLASILRAPIPVPEKVDTCWFALKMARWNRVALGRELMSLISPARGN